MLRISKKADYAVYLLGAIARQGAFPGGEAADSVVSAHEAARQVGLNKSVVANLLKDCARFGLLESVRGLRGGYRLARRPSDVSLGQILEAVEGPFSLVDCCASASDTCSTACCACPFGAVRLALRPSWRTALPRTCTAPPSAPPPSRHAIVLIASPRA